MKKNKKKLVLIGLLGPVLDKASRERRWDKWRPSVAACGFEDLLVDRFELIYQEKFDDLRKIIVKDIDSVSPETRVKCHTYFVNDPWDFEETYGAFHDFARKYPFDTEKEDYLFHITTGTHVAQICFFLLTEARFFPGRLLQTSPPSSRSRTYDPGTYSIIDLDLSRYDRLHARFQQVEGEGRDFLKSGIQTFNKKFNLMIEEIEQVAVNSRAPILLLGPTGAGKSRLAGKIYELKKQRGQMDGGFVDVNCATLRGDGAMSALFGHKKGAFTGAIESRNGLLREAHGGILFLDEIGEIGGDEQAMLLKALEDKSFLPLGADKEVQSEFQLIAGSNRDLRQDVKRGLFREDLLARINLWTYELPGLKDRREDIEPNLDYELETYSRTMARKVAFNQEARRLYLGFALSPEALWTANFRDLSGSVMRMATLAEGGRINEALVLKEMERLRFAWSAEEQGAESGANLEQLLGRDVLLETDLFDRIQLSQVVALAGEYRNLAEAGRALFAVSREKMKTRNDSDRLRKYFAKFGISWDDIQDQEEQEN